MSGLRGAFQRRAATKRPAAPADAARLLAALPLAVAELDADDRFLFVNYAAEEMFGSSAAFLTGRPLHEILPADHPIFILLDRARRDGATVAEHDLLIEGPRFARRGVSLQAAPLADAPGHLVLALQDSSAARALDQQLSARNAARSITGMAAVLAHEVKNPLSGIRGAAQLLELNASGDDRELAVLIRDEVDRIRDLVERIEVFGDKKLDLQAVNVHRVLEHVRRLAQSGFGARIRFTEIYDPSLPPVLGNRDQLVQVLLNLVKNAAEAVAETERADGEIVLATGFQHGVRLATSHARGQPNLPIFIAVRDNGAGIPEDIRRHLFEPFVSTKATGSGLGLALVAKIVADHGGLINVESRPGRTEFRIHLPQFEERAEGAQ
ncbi:MAG: two-component system sensor histidine kinase NtrB [Acidiphilium sp.]